jgi:hypothetical protein
VLTSFDEVIIPCFLDIISSRSLSSSSRQQILAEFENCREISLLHKGYTINDRSLVNKGTEYSFQMQHVTGYTRKAHLGLITSAPCHEDVWRSEGIPSPFLKLELHGGKSLVSRPYRSMPWGKNHRKLLDRRMGEWKSVIGTCGSVVDSSTATSRKVAGSIRG